MSDHWLSAAGTALPGRVCPASQRSMGAVYVSLRLTATLTLSDLRYESTKGERASRSGPPWGLRPIPVNPANAAWRS